MSTYKFLCVATLVASVLAGCGDMGSGGNCDACSTNSDCDPGKTCALFEGGEHLCADDNTWECVETTTYYH